MNGNLSSKRKDQGFYFVPAYIVKGLDRASPDQTWHICMSLPKNHPYIVVKFVNIPFYMGLYRSLIRIMVTVLLGFSKSGATHVLLNSFIEFMSRAVMG